MSNNPEKPDKHDERIYTLQDVVKERERAMGIAKSFMNSHADQAKHKPPGSVQRIIQDELAEVSRYIMNAISGRTALNIDTPLTDLVLRDLKETT